MKIYCLMFLLTFSLSSVYSQRPIILTESALTLGQGTLEAAIGIEYFKKQQAPSIDLPESEYRLMTTALHWGVADNVDFNLDWRGGLLATLETGATKFDWGELTISTRINLTQEGMIAPALGIRSAVKLPETRYWPHKLGTDETDYFLNLTLTKHVMEVETRLNVGFGILGDPQFKDTQDDVLIVSAAEIIPVSDATRAFIELYGFTGPMDDDDKLVVRFGGWTNFAGVQWNIYGSARLVGTNRDWGAAFDFSESWSLSFAVKKDFSLNLWKNR